MKKLIHIEKTTNNIARVLSIIPPDLGPQFNGQTYIAIEDYTEPEGLDPMDKAYPVYNKDEGKFFYVVEKFFHTANQDRVEIENFKAELNKLITETKALKDQQEKAILELTNMIISLSGAGGGAAATEAIPMPPMPPNA